jgi:hypothetical protein
MPAPLKSALRVLPSRHASFGMPTAAPLDVELFAAR